MCFVKATERGALRIGLNRSIAVNVSTSRFSFFAGGGGESGSELFCHDKACLVSDSALFSLSWSALHLVKDPKGDHLFLGCKWDTVGSRKVAKREKERERYWSFVAVVFHRAPFFWKHYQPLPPMSLPAGLQLTLT